MRFHLVVFVSSCRSGRETDQNNEGKTHTYFNWKIFLSSRPSQLSRSMGRWTFSGAQADIFPETTILCAPVWLCLQGGDLHISAVFWNLQHFLVVESTASSIFLHFPSLTYRWDRYGCVHLAWLRENARVFVYRGENIHNFRVFNSFRFFFTNVIEFFRFFACDVCIRSKKAECYQLRTRESKFFQFRDEILEFS